MDLIMKTNHANLWLGLALLVATGCLARTPLDDWEPDQSASPAAGGATSQGSGTGGTSASYGGVPDTGGSAAMAGASGANISGGMETSSGGSIATGGTSGAVPSGGTTGGGRGGTTGTLPSGGTTGGGRGGTTGAVPSGGTTGGGRGGRGGIPSSSGTTVGGSSSTGGAVPSGGTTGGGRSGRGGTPSSGGTPVGGRGGTAGSGGVGGTGTAGSGGTAGTTCPGLASNEELIDDMNDGDRFIPQVNGRAGAWKDQGDGTSSSTMFPDPDGPFTMTNTGDACRKYAAYVYGGPFVDGNPVFFFGIGGPYNASKYNGISFWAKIDSGTTSGLRVAFPDKDTQIDGALCQASGTGTNLCWDHYGKRINLTTTWTKYSVSFSSLTQDGWGRAGAGFDPSTIYEVQFQIPVNTKFGIWIDDVALTYALGTP